MTPDPEPSDPAVRSYRPAPAAELVNVARAPAAAATPQVPELGGRKNGMEPTRYGDWEKNGRCIDF